MMKKQAWLGVLVAVALAAGCGGDDPMGDAGPVPSQDASTMDAMAPGCGDGVRQRDEVCDDGNTEDGDGCSADCQSDETCGNSIVDIGELCDDGNTEDGDGCRGDCLSDYRCGNGVIDLEADGADADEVCDDGNTLNGDGCSAACDSDESCGNGVVDLGAGEVCDDGNTDDGDDCSADCRTSLLCGNGVIDGAEECDDGNTDDEDGCNASCQLERCGNGRVDAGEDCDDGNTDDTDGCTAACTFTCGADADCADSETCNGEETCMNPGTATSQCVAGTPEPDDTACGTDLACRSGACVPVGCGDGVVSGTEECDDGNNVDGDGCDADCTWTCASAADCSDGNECNGEETCAMPGTLGSRCEAGTALADGAVCDRDMMSSTRDICLASACVASRCGDGFTDTDATPPEQCDDGNTMPGDGCSPTCQTETAASPTGFRFTSLELISPRIVYEVKFGSIPIGDPPGCQDLTDTTVTAAGYSFNINDSLQDSIDPMSTGGTYSLNIVNVLQPLNPASATTPAELHLNASCMESPTPDSCQPGAAPNTAMATLSNQSTGVCFTPDSSVVNTAVGTPAMYPTVNTVGGPCYISSPVDLPISFDIGSSTINIPLQSAQITATYNGGPPANRMISGVITGFLSRQDAADTTVMLPLLGATPLYNFLQAGGRTTTSSSGTTVSSSCNYMGGAAEDDEDTLDPADASSTPGFWFFMNFEAELIDWTAP